MRIVLQTSLFIVHHCNNSNMRDTSVQNSYIFSPDIRERDALLKCVTDNVNYTTVGGWRDESGRPVYQGADGTTCLYVTRGDGVISLHHKRGCADHTSELWRCDIPDSSGEMQSFYAYISNRRSYGMLRYFLSLIKKLTNTLMSLPSKQTVIMCRYNGNYKHDLLHLISPHSVMG